MSNYCCYNKIIPRRATALGPHTVLLDYKCEIYNLCLQQEVTGSAVPNVFPVFTSTIRDDAVACGIGGGSRSRSRRSMDCISLDGWMDGM